MNYGSYESLFVRSVLRRLGILYALGIAKSLVRYFGFQSRYEDKFMRSVLSRVEKDDVVWDVGANIGVYVAVLLNQLDQGSGRLVAFEPVLASFNQLSRKFGGDPRVVLLNVGLGSRCFSGNIGDYDTASRSETSPTFSLVASEVREDLDGDKQAVNIATPESVLRENPNIVLPDVIKIDVEGYEVEVIEGLREWIESRSVRVIAVEIHFRILESRGMSSWLLDFMKLASSSGYGVRWVDHSHVLLERI